MKELPYTDKIDFNKIMPNLLSASRQIGELNGILSQLENPNIILNAITLGEAKDSSEIENIVTTYDEIYKNITSANISNPSVKEVIHYREAIYEGLRLIKKNKILTTNDIIKIHHIIEPEKGGIRTIPGTIIKNTMTNQTIFTPPQTETEIRDLLHNLEVYINNDDIDNADPLLKLAYIHYQFECIHPFYDGNGRTGRIINILYLVMKNRLSQPVLYLSKYINNTKDEYYKYFQTLNKKECSFDNFSNYFLKGIASMATYTINYINLIIRSKKETERLLLEKLPKIFSIELVDYLYYDFYTKNEFFRKKLSISRATATTYLKALVKEGFLIEEKVGLEVIYKNVALFNLTKD